MPKKNKRAPKFRVDEIVAVQRRGLPRARIVRFLHGIPGGAVVLDKFINGFRSWNISDLRKIGPQRKNNA